MEPLTIRLPANTKESLKGEAADRDMSLSEYVRELVSTAREYNAAGGEDADAADLRDRVAELEDTVDTLREERNEAREEVSNLEGRLEEVRARLEDKDDRIESLEGDKQVLTARLEEADNRAAALSDRRPATRDRAGLGSRLRSLFSFGDGEQNE